MMAPIYKGLSRKLV